MPREKDRLSIERRAEAPRLTRSGSGQAGRSRKALTLIECAGGDSHPVRPSPHVAPAVRTDNRRRRAATYCTDM
jgi:hypothetical protein